MITSKFNSFVFSVFVFASSFVFPLMLFPLTLSAASNCSLSFSATTNKQVINPGDTSNYTIKLKNKGKGICQNASYSFYYPQNETYVLSAPAPRASNYYWHVGKLLPGQEYTGLLTTKHKAEIPGSEIRTEACASAGNTTDVCVIAVTSISMTTILPTPPIVPPLFQPKVPPAPIPVVPPVTSSTKESGVWIWNTPAEMATTFGDGQIDKAKVHGFNSIYLTVDDYLSIHNLPSGPSKDMQKAAYFKMLDRIIKKANSLGITVDAEGGWKDWAIQKNRWKGFVLIDMVKEYNILYPNAKFNGFQYDVEPYLLPNYEGDKSTVLYEFIQFIDQSTARVTDSNFYFSIVIPHFYDQTNNWTPKIAYNGVSKHTFTHLLDILDRKPGSKILVMAYRNYFSGNDSTESISRGEIEEASGSGHKTFVVVAQETGNVDPGYVTFYGMSKVELKNALSAISQKFSLYQGYGGTAVHYLDPFLELR
jgi:uncharacterized repeat protein (TIGR01451 family)